MHWCDIGLFYSEVMRAVCNGQIEKSTRTRCTLLTVFFKDGGMFQLSDISGICITGLCCC